MTEREAFEERGEGARVDLTHLLRDVPPEQLRQGVRGAMKERGDFRTAGRQTPWMAAAAILLFASGLGLGVAWNRTAEDRAPVSNAGAPFPTGPAARADAATTWALVLLGGPGYEEPADPVEAERRVAALARWATELADSGRLVLAEELGAPAAVLPAGSATYVAGPALGLFVIRADDATEAATIAAGSPHVLHGGRVAVQPIIPH